jgi:hypothetical protein
LTALLNKPQINANKYIYAEKYKNETLSYRHILNFSQIPAVTPFVSILCARIRKFCCYYYGLFIFVLKLYVVRDSSVGIETVYGLDGTGIESWCGRNFRTHPEEPWGQPSQLYNGYWVIFGDKAAGAWR